VKLYIANRSEIARRIIRSASRMGIPTCVGFAVVDKDLPFVREADRAKLIRCDNSRDAYLNSEIVIQTAKEMGATHLHPGYGFLSENADFVEKLLAAGLEFVGPRPESMRKLGDKIGSRRFLQTLNIPLLPSYEGDDQSIDRFKAEASNLGYPLLVKPSAGGGGKGMFRVKRAADLEEAVDSSKRTSKASFNDDRIFLEKFVDPARHIEVQILADRFGNVHVLGERECSMQRRHQKLIEETPCNFISEKLRKQIFDHSIKIARAVNYESAGTVEWIWDGNDGIYFLEVNTRLQVEHAVTEAVTGIDLVECQLRVSRNEKLENVKSGTNGHSIEVRLCAEDPAKDFLPSGGKIHYLRLPDENLRVDFGYAENNVIGSDFDSMLGKIISHGKNRSEAIEKMITGLETLCVMGPTTNRAYLLQILKSESFSKGKLSTRMLESFPYHFNLLEALRSFQDLQGDPRHFVESDSHEDLDLHSPWGGLDSSPASEAWWMDFENQRYFHLSFTDWSIPRPRKNLSPSSSVQDEASLEKLIKSPMPSKIIKILVREGQNLKKGEALIILEAMKMEHKIKCSHNAKVSKILVTEGQQVPPDESLIELE